MEHIKKHGAHDIVMCCILFFPGSAEFRIDQNGKLFSRTQLTAGTEYAVVVQVVDTKAQAFASSQIASAEILVLAGSRPPQFYQQAYQVSIQEHRIPSMYVYLSSGPSYMLGSKNNSIHQSCLTCVVVWCVFFTNFHIFPFYAA